MDRPESTRGRRSSSSTLQHKDRPGASRPGGEVDEEALPPGGGPSSEALPERAASVLARIGDEFNHRRESNRTAAFGWLQHELWANVSTLVPYAITFEKLIDKSIGIEDFIKSDTGTTTQEPLEVFREFLSAPDDKPLKIKPN